MTQLSNKRPGEMNLSPSPRTQPDSDRPDGSTLVFSRWSNRIFTCSEKCGFVGSLDGFKWGHCYDPCPRCGAPRTDFGRTGRFVYRLEPLRWFPIVKRKVFVRVEWRYEHEGEPQQAAANRGM